MLSVTFLFAQKKQIASSHKNAPRKDEPKKGRNEQKISIRYPTTRLMGCSADFGALVDSPRRERSLYYYSAF